MNSVDLHVSKSDEVTMKNDILPETQIQPLNLFELQDDFEKILIEDDVKSNDKQITSELRLRYQSREKKQRIDSHVQILQEDHARQQLRFELTEHSSGMLKTPLTSALKASNNYQQGNDLELALQFRGREQMSSIAALLEEAQCRYEDAEFFSQNVASKLSSRQASIREHPGQNLLSSTSPTFYTAPHDDLVRIESYRRYIELLCQELELTAEQAAERQNLTVSQSRKDAQFAHPKIPESMEEDCDRKLTDWRYGNAVCAQTDNPQAQAEPKTEMPASEQSDSNLSTKTLVEVLVRMQLEQVRTRRFEALKRALLIRHAKQNQAAKEFLCRWKLHLFSVRMTRLGSVQSVHRIMLLHTSRKKLSYFYKWRNQIRQLIVHTSQRQALVCCNRMIAAERIRRIFDQITVKRLVFSFHRWCRQTFFLAKGIFVHSSNDAGVNEEDLQSLHREIKKLHDQLASSKSEAWRYKRQLLKQFL
ncbi:uncharacterized protein PHALS_06304 [Plasmopara halstedii]|uniref:Uncharacterized protein n=1 Tax=Plasmopara halstedii TaxID=4781 RepID=A0A0P1B2W3_PLAHL|nr:uncharacterized protein PHALS_06304 [Plasmopara halstedii]CEG48485.1 hypothetical protein PHALS_06304 [Plasmopara halstedii]|eukprot:XP_024584854.1 hypothetical protein PHALS_06304 [Plasmopara halstedii]